MDGGMEKQKEAEKDKESYSVDGVQRRSADARDRHQKAPDDHKYHTLGYQKKKQKGRLVSTFGKGSTNTNSRGAPIQVLFKQGSPEKTPMQEERGSVGGSQSQAELLKQTLQTFATHNEINWSGEGEKAVVLENSWTDIVHSHKSMPRTQRYQQEALWELIHTEFIYINKLTIITDLVLAALEHVHRLGFLHEVTADQLFSNMPSIRDAHRCFWQEVMYPMLQNARLTGHPFDPLKLEPGCLQFAERFSAYLDYCWEEERNMEFTRRQMEINQHFNMFLTWVETHPQCGRMRLGDMQAKPHQRITKYPLLLKSILKATQDQYTQQTLNRMINSVSQFLDSINDYLLFKDDELALFALSQKIEGYELQGMSEEIDKYMQEFCCFDLTSPVRDTEPKVIRKLLMGESLKVRGRKDSKLEVVLLLFTDVLLLTKTQKKSEKQKLVCPHCPWREYALQNSRMATLFVLLEVSDLGCPVNVYSVSTPSPGSCASWITAIHQAQENLQSLRKKETIKLEEPSDQSLEDPFPPASTPNIKETEEQSDYKSPLASLKFTTIQLEREEPSLQNQHVHAHFLSKQMQKRDKEFNNEHNMTQETERRKGSRNGHCEDSDTLYGPTIERRVTWNHKLQSHTKSNAFPQQDSLETNKSNGSHYLLVNGLRENSALSQSPSGQFLLPSKFVPIESAISVKQPQSQKPDLRQDSWTRQSGDENESLSESQTFTRILKSPRLRRKRPMNSQPFAAVQGSRRMSAEAESSTSFPYRNSNSVSDSDENHNVRRPSNTSSKSQDHLVLNLASIKQNQVVFWNVPSERLSELESDLQKERHNQNSQKLLKGRAQRSESLPELPSSTLQGILNRAKERERGRGITNREGNYLEKNSLQSSNTVCATPSSSPSEGEKEAGAEDQETFRSRKYYSLTGMETSSDNYRKNRPVTPLGVNVDWPGWCFDDEDVLEFTAHNDETVDWPEQTLTTAELQKTPRHNHADYSEV